MDLAGYVINAVLVEGRSVAEVAAAHGLSRSWLYELLARYRAEGEEGLKPKSRQPRSSPTKVPVAMEDEIVALRKALTEDGLDAGAPTIHYHLLCRHRRRKTSVPSVATIWRVLSRRGFVTPQPHKRPASSWKRFEAELPNECWQADTTHWALADGTDVEILNVVDDHSRLLVASRAFVTTKAADVVETFHLAAEDHGLPAAMLTDNGAIGARTKAVPRLAPLVVEGHHVRRDRVDKTGTVTLRYRSKLLHIGVGRAHAGTRVLLLVADLDVRIMTDDGALLRHLTLDPTKDYQARGRPLDAGAS